jgi:hypothetical protein
MGPSKNLDFWLSSLIIFVTVYFMVVIYLHWYNLGFFFGPFRLNHWLVWIGSLFIAFAVPAFALSKRRYPTKTKSLLRFHVFGNLLAFLLISLHFASQIGRPAAFFPELGTGLALYVVMLLLTVTGFSHRFRTITRPKPQTTRFLHVSVALSFYIIIGIHILHGLGVF